MIRNLAQCPYCKNCEIALDDRPDLVFNPESSGVPCMHLAWLDCRYSQWEPSEHGVPRVVGSSDFNWYPPETGDEGQIESLMPYLRELANQGTAWAFAPDVPFGLETLSAEEKATDARGHSYTASDVDGCAVFAQEPAAFWAAVPECQQRQLTGLNVDRP
jgi:hypothetical protein